MKFSTIALFLLGTSVGSVFIIAEGTVAVDAIADVDAAGPAGECDGGTVEASATSKSPVDMEQDESINADNPAQQQGNTDDGEHVQETLGMADTIRKHLVDNDWNFDEVASDEEKVVLKMTAKGDNGSYKALLKIEEPRYLFTVFVHSEIGLSTNNLEQLAVFLTRVNFGLIYGNFELHMDDGELRFKNSIYISGSFISSRMIATMLHSSFFLMDKHFECIVQVAYGVLSPEDAIKKISKIEEDL